MQFDYKSSAGNHLPAELCIYRYNDKGIIHDYDNSPRIESSKADRAAFAPSPIAMTICL